jgi:hypothetical protein
VNFLIILIILLIVSFVLNVYQFIKLSQVRPAIESCEGQIACVKEHIAKVEEKLIMINIRQKSGLPPARRPKLYGVEES